MKNHWIMDYETLKNCFIAVFEHYKEDKRRVFAIHPLTDKSQYSLFINFLKENIENDEWHISYNGLSFDSQVTEYILKNCDDWYSLSNEEIAHNIYLYAQELIIRDRGVPPDFPEWKLSIKQIDLFKMNHWDNVAKRSSLKWIQYSMDWGNVEDMPISPHAPVTSIEQMETIIRYCINDVTSTKKILDVSKEQLMLRKSLTEEYGINLYSASETKIARELFAHFLSKQTGIAKHELKQMRTHRTHVSLNECILPYVSFDTKIFQDLLNFFRGKVVRETKGALNHKIHYKNMDVVYGLGGVHGAREAGIYEAKDGYTIMTSDVTSFYPNLAIRNKLAPAHIDKDQFCALYEWFFEERKKYPKSDPKNYVFKIILNSTYGLSNDENSFLYDPKLTMSITINGQLLLSKLLEMLAEQIPGSIPLMINTDGLEMMIPTSFKDKYLEICQKWEQLTNLQLEHDQYKKIIIADVNSYIAIYENPHKEPKCKGRFEWKDLQEKKVAVLHKNKSFLIIPKAIYHYFVNGTDPKDYLKENREIYDYCGGIKAKGDWSIVAISVNRGEITEEVLQKTNRYFVCKGGVKLIRRNKTDGREIQVDSGHWTHCIYNRAVSDQSFDELNVNEDYYLEQIYKEINQIDKQVTRKYTQLELF